MAKDKGKKTKPSPETKDVVKIQDDAVKAKEAKAEAKDVSAFQPSKEEDHVRFLVRQSLGLTLIAEHPVVRRKRGPSKDSTYSSFSSPIPSMLVRLLLEQDCGSTIPPNFLFCS